MKKIFYIFCFIIYNIDTMQYSESFETFKKLVILHNQLYYQEQMIPVIRKSIQICNSLIMTSRNQVLGSMNQSQGVYFLTTLIESSDVLTTLGQQAISLGLVPYQSKKDQHIQYFYNIINILSDVTRLRIQSNQSNIMHIIELQKQLQRYDDNKNIIERYFKNVKKKLRHITNSLLSISAQ